MEDYKPQKRSKREKLMIQLQDKSEEIQQCNNDLFTNIDFQLLLFFCNQHRNYTFSSDSLEKLKQNPIQSQFLYFAQVHNQVIEKKNFDKQIVGKLKQMLQEHRITPKILTQIKVRENEIQLNRWTIGFQEEIMKVLKNDDYIIYGMSNDELQNIKNYSDTELIAKLLEQLVPLKEKYITNEYLTTADIQIIKETHILLGKINGKVKKSYQVIFQCFDQIVNFINSSSLEFDNEGVLNKVSPIKQAIFKKIGKIYLLELVKLGIGIPSIIQQITLLEASQQNCFGQFGTINIRFSQGFLCRLSKKPELAKVTEKLELKKLEKFLSWKGFKSYYFSNIVEIFSEYEKYTEEDCLQLQLECLLQNNELYKVELIKMFKTQNVVGVILKIEQRVTYYIEKEQSESLNSSTFQIGLQLLDLKKKTMEFESIIKSSRPQKEIKCKNVKKPPLQRNELDHPQDEYRSPTVMLCSQRMKFSYLIKCFIKNLIKDRQPYPFIISIIKCYRFTIRILINFQVLEFFVRDDLFIRFIQDQYNLDISEGTTQDRIKKIISLSYTDITSLNLLDYSWTALLTEQADLIYESRDRLSWEFEKYFKVKQFDKEVDKIQDCGDTCPKRIELSKKIKRIRDYIFQRE